MAQKTAWTGAALTESDINTYLMHEGGAFSTWTPVVVQSATPTLTVSRAVYGRAGRYIYGDAYVTLTSGGTGANIITITVPVAIASSSGNTIIGHGWVFDQSTGFFYFGLLLRQSSTTVSFLRYAEGAGATYLGTHGFTAALASSDILSIQFAYEASS